MDLLKNCFSWLKKGDSGIIPNLILGSFQYQSHGMKLIWMKHHQISAPGITVHNEVHLILVASFISGGGPGSNNTYTFFSDATPPRMPVATRMTTCNRNWEGSIRSSITAINGYNKPLPNRSDRSGFKAS